MEPTLTQEIYEALLAGLKPVMLREEAVGSEFRAVLGALLSAPEVLVAQNIACVSDTAVQDRLTVAFARNVGARVDAIRSCAGETRQ